MLNSCASNVTVVNIDNGFGAAFSAGLVYQQVVRGRKNE
jgi:NCAIR mutase (PurE)-related protein